MTTPNVHGGPEPIANRVAESVARLVLSSLGPAGAILGEAVGFARSIHDDGQVAAARAALEQRLGSLSDRLSRLEASGAAVRISGERAQILAAATRYANEHVVGYYDVDDTLRELNLTADVYREAVQELEELGAVVAYGNLNHASGFSGVSVTPATFVQLVDQVVPGVVVARDLGEILDVFRTAKNPGWVLREEFEALKIPTPRIQHLLEYLEEEGLVELHGPADSVERLMFLNAELKARGRRVLRGDEIL
jgi:hypothetical protein